MDKETKKVVKTLMGDTSLSAIEILDKLELDFNTHYEGLFVDGNIAHLHKAKVIKDIIEFIVDHDGWRYSIPDFTPDLSDNIRRMKEYLVVAGHWNSPVAPKPKQRDSCGEVSS